MKHERALERAIVAEIAFLEGELARIRAGKPPAREPIALPERTPLDDNPMSYALRDPAYQRWLLQQQLEDR